MLPNLGMVRKLWKENWGKIDAETYSSFLLRERTNNSPLDKFWEWSELWYEQKNMPRREFSNKCRKSFDDKEFLHAIITYTMEEKDNNVYDDFNNKCREFA